MLKRTNLLAAAALVAFGLSTTAASAQDDYYGDDCHDQNRAAGTIVGAIAGGLIGNSIGRGGGRAAATVGGVFLGGVVGNQIAGDVDCDDRPYAFDAYRESFNGPVGQRYDWDGHGHGHGHGYITSTREYWRDGQLCRDFEETSWHHGEEYTRDGTACRDRDGEWRFY
jgi:surface antigen